MERDVDLVCQEVLNDSTPDMDLSFNLNEEISRKNDARLLTTDDDFSHEYIQDLISNRIQREKFTKQIIIIMCVELTFIGILLSSVFLIFCLNSLAPKITFNFPPIFLTLSLTLLYFYLYKFCEGLPKVRIACKQVKLKKHQFSLNHWLKVLLTIIFIILLNIFARESHAIYYTPIILSDNVIHMILYTALAVFVKTTLLAGYIIKGLYQALNSRKNEATKK